MNEMFVYSLAVSIPLALMWSAYRIAFSGRGVFALNRMLLLGIYIVALTLSPAIGLMDRFAASGAGAAQGIQAGDVYSALTGAINLFSSIWAVGCCVAFALTLVEWVRIARIIFNSTKTDVDGLRIYVAADKKIAPFSICGVVVMSREDYEGYRTLVLAHEAGHIKLCHSFDLFLAQAVAILCWYNPAAWLMKRDLKTVHEFQADAYAIGGGCDLAEYQTLLISKAAKRVRYSGLSNHFGGSVLKKRIMKMDSSEAGKIKTGWRYGVVAASLLAGGWILCSPAAMAVIHGPGISSANRVAEKSFPMDIYVEGERVEYENLNGIPAGEIKAITIDKTKDRIDVSLK